MLAGDMCLMMEPTVIDKSFPSTKVRNNEVREGEECVWNFNERGMGLRVSLGSCPSPAMCLPVRVRRAYIPYLCTHSEKHERNLAAL